MAERLSADPTAERRASDERVRSSRWQAAIRALRACPAVSDHVASLNAATSKPGAVVTILDVLGHVNRARDAAVGGRADTFTNLTMARDALGALLAVEVGR